MEIGNQQLYKQSIQTNIQELILLIADKIFRGE